MKFFNMLPGQRLILISTTNAMPRSAAPVTARSTNRRTVTARAIAMVQAITFFLCWHVGRPLCGLHKKFGQLRSGRAIRTIYNAWTPIPSGETLAWLRIGAMFLLFSMILAARG